MILIITFLKTNQFKIYANLSQTESLDIAIIQLVTHPSLNDIHEGIIEGLESHGYQDGRSLTVKSYNAEGDMTLLNSLAKQAVHENPDYLIAITTPVAQSLQQVTQEIPIIMAGITDPIAAKLVDSLEHPGGNVSGISDFIPIKEQFKFIKDHFPGFDKIGILYSVGEDNSEAEVIRAKEAAQDQGFEVIIEGLSTSIDMQKVAKSIVPEVDAMYVGSDNTIASAFDTLLKVTEETGKPIFSPVEPMIQQGAYGGLAIEQKEIGTRTAEFLINIYENDLNISKQAVEFMDTYKEIINPKTEAKFKITDTHVAEKRKSLQIWDLYFNAMTQGILWAVMGLGLFISFRILKFADLTSEASFTMGAATALLFLNMGFHPVLAMIIAMIAGSFAGLITALLMNLFDIPGLLASIISLTGLYSVNLRIMGRPNLSIRGIQSIFELSFMNNLFVNNTVFIVGGLIVVLLVTTLNHFFKLDIGQALIATGDNEVMAKSIGIRVNRMKIIALMLSNGLIALCGSLIGQNNGFSDISMGTGTVVIGLSSIVIGEVILHQELSLVKRLLSILIGSIIYQIILTFVLQLGFHPNDFKLVSAIVLATFLAFPKFRNKITSHGNIGKKRGRYDETT